MRDQCPKSLIVHYTCDTNSGRSFGAATAGRKDSPPGRLYISLLERLVRASLFGTNVKLEMLEAEQVDSSNSVMAYKSLRIESK